MQSRHSKDGIRSFGVEICKGEREQKTTMAKRIDFECCLLSEIYRSCQIYRQFGFFFGRNMCRGNTTSNNFVVNLEIALLTLCCAKELLSRNKFVAYIKISFYA